MVLIWVVLFAAGAVQGFFQGGILWTHSQGNKAANRLLAAFLATFSISLGYFAFLSTGYIIQFPHLLLLTLALPFQYGPLLYGYMKCQIANKTTLHRRDAWHLLPFLLYVLALLPFYLQSAQAKEAFMRQGGIRHSQVLWIAFYSVATLMTLHMLWYAYKGWLLQRLATNLSSLQQGWYKKILFCFAVYIVLFLSFHIMEITIGHQAMWLCYLLKLLMALSMYGIGAIAFRHPKLFSPALRQVKSTVKYQRSSLSDQEGKALAARISHCMQQEKLFLDPELTLAQLAQRVGCTPHILSQVLNEYLNTSFPELLNRFRIEEAQRRLSSPETAEEIILKVALEVGFNNKASFNTAFKKITGTTPSAYKKAALAGYTTPGAALSSTN